MIDIRPTTEEDFKAAVALALPIYNQGPLHPQESMVTVFWDEDVLGVFSVGIMSVGVVLIGAILTTHIHKYPVALTRFIKRELAAIHVRNNVHRIQIEVRADYEAGHAFAEALGFTKEGVMKMFGPDKQDYSLYARTH